MDFDPEAVRSWAARGVPMVYGDAEDPELPDALPLGAARWVVSTARRRDTSLALLHALHHHHYTGRVALSADGSADADVLETVGADHVFRPFDHAADHAAALLASDRGVRD